MSRIDPLHKEYKKLKSPEIQITIERRSPSPEQARSFEGQPSVTSNPTTITKRKRSNSQNETLRQKLLQNVDKIQIAGEQEELCQQQQQHMASGGTSLFQRSPLNPNLSPPFNRWSHSEAISFDSSRERSLIDTIISPPSSAPSMSLPFARLVSGNPRSRSGSSPSSSSTNFGSTSEQQGCLSLSPRGQVASLALPPSHPAPDVPNYPPQSSLMVPTTDNFGAIDISPTILSPPIERRDSKRVSISPDGPTFLYHPTTGNSLSSPSNFSTSPLSSPFSPTLSSLSSSPTQQISVTPSIERSSKPASPVLARLKEQELPFKKKSSSASLKLEHPSNTDDDDDDDNNNGGGGGGGGDDDDDNDKPSDDILDSNEEAGGGYFQNEDEDIVDAQPFVAPDPAVHRLQLGKEQFLQQMKDPSSNRQNMETSSSFDSHTHMQKKAWNNTGRHPAFQRRNSVQQINPGLLMSSWGQSSSISPLPPVIEQFPSSSSGSNLVPIGRSGMSNFQHAPTSGSSHRLLGPLSPPPLIGTPFSSIDKNHPSAQSVSAMAKSLSRSSGLPPKNFGSSDGRNSVVESKLSRGSKRRQSQLMGLPSSGSHSGIQENNGRDLTWNERFKTLMKHLSEFRRNTNRKKRIKVYQKLASLAQDFAFTAESFGRVIISEATLEPSRKTIKPADLSGSLSGQKFEKHSCILKFAYTGISEDDAHEYPNPGSFCDSLGHSSSGLCFGISPRTILTQSDEHLFGVSPHSPLTSPSSSNVLPIPSMTSSSNEIPIKQGPTFLTHSPETSSGLPFLVSSPPTSGTTIDSNPLLNGTAHTFLSSHHNLFHHQEVNDNQVPPPPPPLPMNLPAPRKPPTCSEFSLQKQQQQQSFPSPFHSQFDSFSPTTSTGSFSPVSSALPSLGFSSPISTPRQSSSNHLQRDPSSPLIDSWNQKNPPGMMDEIGGSNQIRRNPPGMTDEEAMKIAGHELKALDNLLSCQTPGLNFPLMTLIDYKGFRLVVVSKLPINNNTLIYGSSNALQTYQNNRELGWLIDTSCSSLNLRVHKVNKQPNQLTYAPIDLEGHRGIDNCFYLVDFSRLFPPQRPRNRLRSRSQGTSTSAITSLHDSSKPLNDSSSTNQQLNTEVSDTVLSTQAQAPASPTLSSTTLPSPALGASNNNNTTTTNSSSSGSSSSGGSNYEHLYRLFRPEFLRKYLRPLCNDAFSKFLDPSESLQINADVRTASEEFEKSYVPRVAKELIGLKTNDYFNSKLLIQFLHRKGVNLRYMGHLYNILRDTPWGEPMMAEMVARCIKWQLRSRMRRASKAKASLLPGDVGHKMEICSHLNLLMGESAESRFFWTGKLKEDLERRFFGLSLPTADSTSTTNTKPPTLRETSTPSTTPLTGSSQNTASTTPNRHGSFLLSNSTNLADSPPLSLMFLQSKAAAFQQHSNQLHKSSPFPRSLFFISGSKLRSLTDPEDKALYRCNQLRRYLIQRICTMLAIRTKQSHTLSAACLYPGTDCSPIPFSHSHIEELQPRIKHLRLMEHSQGIVLSHLSRQIHIDSYTRTRYIHQAIEYFERALECNPSSKYTLRNCAEMYQRLKKNEHAEHYFKLAIEMDGHDPKSMYKYARFLNKTGRIEEAAAFFKKAIDVSKQKHPGALACYGKFFAQQGKLVEAREMFIQATEYQDTCSPHEHYQFGKFLEFKVVELPAAFEEYKMAEETDQENKPSYLEACARCLRKMADQYEERAQKITSSFHCD